MAKRENIRIGIGKIKVAGNYLSAFLKFIFVMSKF